MASERGDLDAVLDRLQGFTCFVVERLLTRAEVRAQGIKGRGDIEISFRLWTKRP